VIVLALLIFFALLPVIKVDISSQSRGMVRSTTDNVLTSLVNGKVTFVNLKIIVSYKRRYTGEITQENLDTEKATNQDLSGDLQDQIRDLTLVILDKSNSLKTLPCNKNGIVMSRQNELKAKLPKLKRFMNATKIV
jgi:HlyD family secretion protein